MCFEGFVSAVIREIHDLGMTMSVEEQNNLWKLWTTDFYIQI